MTAEQDRTPRILLAEIVHHLAEMVAAQAATNVRLDALLKVMEASSTAAPLLLPATDRSSHRQ